MPDARSRGSCGSISRPSGRRRGRTGRGARGRRSARRGWSFVPGRVDAGQLCVQRRHGRQRHAGAADRVAGAAGSRGRVESHPRGRHAQSVGPAVRFPGQSLLPLVNRMGPVVETATGSAWLLSGRRRAIHGPGPARAATRPPGSRGARRDHRSPSQGVGSEPPAAYCRARVPYHCPEDRLG